MNVWRSLGAMLILGVVALVATQLVPVHAQEKKEEKKAAAQDKKDEKKEEKKAAPQDKKEDKKEEKKEEKKAEAPPAGGGDTLEWKAFEKGKEFYQELTTKTTQTMKVMGQEVQQTQEQTFYIQWVPGD